MSKENHITNLPKKGLKTRPYNMDMNKEDHITNLPKKGLRQDHITWIWRSKISRNLVNQNSSRCY